MMSLALAPKGQEVFVMKCITEDKTKHHLENLGIVSGAAITPVFESSGDIVIRIKGCKLAINRELASRIYVKLN